MKPVDKNYLLLQFQNQIYKKNSTEFQSFFESIMEMAFSDFQKIRPYGNVGDGGNDGYRKEAGIYYQVYAPINPNEKEAYAAKKLKDDFQKLKTNWDKISSIQKYFFVFNDKYRGSVQPLELAISELNNENNNISFELFLPKNLENTFFKLNKSDMNILGFDIDSTKAVAFAFNNLENVKIELDREIVKFAQKILENSKEIISELNDENLSLEYEILECRCLQKIEKVDKALEKYKNISNRFPNDPRSFLYLAEIYLNNKDYDKNKELLEQAKKINNDFWLLKLEQLVRKIYLGEKIDTNDVDEKTFPDDLKIKTNFYRLYASFFEESKNHKKADYFIERAIHSNPNRFSNYVTKLLFIERRLLANQDASQRLVKSQELLSEIIKVENKFSEFGEIGARFKAILNIRKMNALNIQENLLELEKISKETFELSITCHFDIQIEQILTGILQYSPLSNNDINKLLVYLKSTENEISDELSKALIFQFKFKDNLFTVGTTFFKDIGNQKYSDFIINLENEDYDKISKFLENDKYFAVILANSLKDLPDLRKKIIENLPDDINIQKDKLFLLLNFDEKDFDQAFNLLKQMDLSGLNYFECGAILQIVHQKKAWDFEIIILEKLLQKEINEKRKFDLKVQLFNALLNLKKYQEVVNIGIQLLQEDSIENKLDSKNKEALLTNTIIACFERSKVDKEISKKSMELLGKYKLEDPSFEFKAGIESEVYLKNIEPEKALKSVIDGVIIKKILSPQEYAKLYFLLTIRIGNQLDLKLDSFEKVEKNTFIKLKNKDQWYFIGNNNELDAIKINTKNDKYSLFIDKKLRDEVVFENKYSSDIQVNIIEIILPIERYVIWQVLNNFSKLSKDGDLEGVKLIELPPKEDTVDPKNLLKMLEDLHKKTEPLFEMYCEKHFPLAVLALSEGGLTNAIGLIQQENKGFINFSIGNNEEFGKQKEIAQQVINNKIPFYIDGTSAIFLSESGQVQKIYKYLPNLKIPQSVINLLADVTEKFTSSMGQVAYMGYAQEKIRFSSIEKDKNDLIHSNFLKSIKLFESKKENISVISSVNKADCLSEKEIFAELSDACILAQNENIPILTEDFLYLKMNEIETEKTAPKYFSSLALFRVLYENRKIKFEDYINYFGYLSSYRFRFLSLNSDDIEKTVFGDSKIKIVKPENIRKLNFPLTLSEEYGVSFNAAFSVIRGFLLKILMDNSITLDIAENIFIELLESLPKKYNKRDFGQRLVINCFLTIEKNKSEFILYPKIQLINNKINKLLQVTKIYGSIVNL